MRAVSYNLTGVVRNMGLPIANTVLTLYRFDDQDGLRSRVLVGETKTSSTGEFTFEVDAGRYVIEVTPSNQTRFAREATAPINVADNLRIVVRLKHGCAYSGKVRTKGGGKVATSELLIFAIEPSAFFLTEQVSADGTFNITLPKGTYLIACRTLHDASKSKKEIISLCSVLTKVELVDDTVEDIVMPPLMVLKGVVTDGDGHPVANVEVSITPLEARKTVDLSGERELKGNGKTSRIGQFQCELERGTYEISFKPPQETATTQSKSYTIEIGENLTRTFSLHPGFAVEAKRADGEVRNTAKVHFAVLNGSDEPIPNCEITFERYGVSNVRSEEAVKYKTSANGQCIIELEPAVYSFRIMPPEDSGYQMKELRQFSVSQDVRRRVRLVSGGNVTQTQLRLVP